jgi:hypothetical protein
MQSIHPREASVPEITRDGVQLYFSVSGGGPAVLFHTGGAGDIDART